MPILGYDADVIDHIVRFADAHDLSPVCLLALGLQEGNLDTSAHGDVTIGDSWGVFQIYLPAHGHDAAWWTGLDGLDRSMAEMVGRWHEAFRLHGGWLAVTSDIVGFQQAWAPDAQGSIAWDEPMARARISLAVALYALYLKAQTTPVTPTDPRVRQAIDDLTALALGLDDLGTRADLQAQAARAAAAKLAGG